MRVLLDECLPRQLASLIPDHTVTTVPQAGWAGKTNGELLELAASAFDVFITIDQGIAYQQNLASASLAVVFLRARTNRLADLAPLVPGVLTAIHSARPGQPAVVEP